MVQSYRARTVLVARVAVHPVWGSGACHHPSCVPAVSLRRCPTSWSPVPSTNWTVASSVFTLLMELPCQWLNTRLAWCIRQQQSGPKWAARPAANMNVHDCKEKTRRLYCVECTQCCIRPKRSAVCNRSFHGPIRVLNANDISTASEFSAGLTRWQTDRYTTLLGRSQ